MADRVVIVRVGAHLVSLPFDRIDEILGTDRIASAEELPEDLARGGSKKDAKNEHWVLSRGTWFPVDKLIPDSDISSSSQIVVVRFEETARAFAVDQVLGIEAPGEMAPFPERAHSFTDIPIAGVRFWKDGPVLELDLSRVVSLDLES